MADIRINLDVSGVKSGAKTIKISYDDILKRSEAMVKSSDLLQKSMKSSFDSISRGSRNVKDLSKEYGIINTNLGKLKRGLIDAETFQLKYGKAIASVKKEIKDSYGENNKALLSFKRTNDAIKEYNNNVRVTKSIVANTFKDGAKALKQVAIEAEKAEKAQKKYNRSVVSNELQRGAKALKQIERETKALEKANQKLQKSQDSLIKKTDVFTIALGNLAAKGLAVVSGFLLDAPRLFKEYSDAWTAVTSKIKVSVDSHEELASVTEKVFRIAQETRSPLEAQATLYNRLTLSQKELGASQEEILSVIRGVGFALSVTATSALESRGALIQLSQAFGQGIVRAEEFNSIMEGTPRIAKAIADGFGVTRAQLRSMVLEGKVTSKEFFEAFKSQVPLLEVEFTKVNVTIEQSFVVLRNAIVKLIGKFNEATGASRNIAGIFIGIGNTIEVLTPIVIEISSLFREVWGILTAFPVSVIEYFKNLNKEIGDTGTETENFIKKFEDLTPLEKFNTSVLNIIKNLSNSVKSILSALGRGFGYLINEFIRLINQFAITIAGLGFIMESAFRLDFAGVKNDINALKTSWKDYFKDSEQGWINYEEAINKINEEANKKRIAITDVTGKSQAEREREIKEEAESLRKQYEIRFKKEREFKDIEAAFLKEEERKKLELFENTFKATGILNDEYRTKKIKGFKEEEEALIKSGFTKAEAHKVYLKRIESLDKKSSSTKIKHIKKNDTLLSKSNSQNFKDYEKFEKEKIKALKKFSDEFNKSVLNEFDYEREKLKERYEYYEKFVEDKIALEQWFLNEKKKIDKEEIEAANKKYKEFADAVEKETKDVFKDIFTGELDSFSDFTDRMKDMFFDMLAAMAAKAIAEPIIVPMVQGIAGGISGLFGLPGAPAAPGALTDGFGLSDVFTAGKTLYGAFTGGIEAAASEFLTTGIAGGIGAGIFGTAWGGAAGAATTQAAALGYTAAVDVTGLAAGGAVGGTVGAGAGIAGILAAAAPWLAVGALAIPLITSLFEDEPDYRIGIRTGEAERPLEELIPKLGAGEAPSEFGYATFLQDLSTEYREQVGPVINEYFDRAFTQINELIGGNINEIIAEEPFDIRVDPTSFETFEEALAQLSENVFEELSGRLVRGLVVPDIAALFDVDFFKNIAIEGETAFDTFIRFGNVIKNTSNFQEKFNAQINTFGKSAEVAFKSIEAINRVFLQIDESLRTLELTQFTTELISLANQWNGFIYVLEQSKATVEELTQAENARNIAIGTQITGLTAQSLQGIISAGGDISEAINKSITTALAASLAESIAEKYIIPLNEKIGEAYIESGGDIEAAINILEKFDTSKMQNEIDELQRRLNLGISKYSLTDQIKDIEGQLKNLETLRTPLINKLNIARQNYLNSLDNEINIQTELRDKALAAAESFRNLGESILKTRTQILGQVTPEAPVLAKSEYEKALQGAFAGEVSSLEALPALAERYIESIKRTTADPVEFNKIITSVSQQLSTVNDITSALAREEEFKAYEAQRQIGILIEQRNQIENSNMLLLGLQQAADEYHEADLALKESKFDTQINILTEQLSALQAIVAASQLAGVPTEEFISTFGGEVPSINIGGTFDEETYFQNKAAQINAAIAAGDRETKEILSIYGISPDQVDVADVKSAFGQAGLTAIEHFLQYGISEGLSPVTQQSFNGGGIATGPSTGYYAELHGTEAVIPLQGNNIPIDITDDTDDKILTEILQTLKSLVSVNGNMKVDQSEILDIITRITQGQNYINTKEVA